jgi:hypothetical protein
MRTIFNYKEMNDEKWKNFREILDNKTDLQRLKGELNSNLKDQRWINRVWDTIEGIIKETIKETIPTKEICKSEISGRPKLKTETACRRN